MQAAGGYWGDIWFWPTSASGRATGDFRSRLILRHRELERPPWTAWWDG